MTRTTYYDIEPLGSELWIVVGPAGWTVADLRAVYERTDGLPDGFRWLDEDEVVPWDRVVD